MKKFGISLIFTLFVMALSAQKNAGLTHVMNAQERALMSRYVFDFSETAPPDGSVRNIAEWEDMEAVVIAYTGGFGIPLSSIAEMSEDTKLITIVANAGEENTVTNIYASNGVNLDNCLFLYQDPDSYWTRDYSAWFIGVDDDHIAIVDFPYNRPRPHDDEVPVLLSQMLGTEWYGMNLVHTGGNYMCDGYGVAASTDLVWEENTSLTHEQIQEKVQDYLGINTYHVTIDPLDDYIKHIDCWGKFLDVDKVLITQVPQSDYRYDDYESVAQYFASQDCSWGYPYEVIRVQAADIGQYDVNPYTNSLILNDKVFVPVSGSSLDSQAIDVYETHMPGYQIIPVYDTSWLNSDAFHCRTHGIADREMLFIRHYPLHGTVDYQSSYEIQAEVFSYGGSPLSDGFPVLSYRLNGGEWTEVQMDSEGGNLYSADIPADITGNVQVDYYIRAENQNGKAKSQPRMGALDPHSFTYNTEIGTADYPEKITWYMYPNPVKSICHFHTDDTDGTLSISTLDGKVVFVASDYTGDVSVDVSRWAKGVYLVHYQNGKGKATKKMIVE